MRENNTWVCIASGPSLTAEDVEHCREQGWSLAAVNTSWEIAKDSKIIYAADYRWWEQYYEKVKREAPQAELWTASSTCAKKFNINHCLLKPGAGWSNKKPYAFTGSLSGFQAIQVVGWERPDRIILLGYDMKHGEDGKTHWHGDHPLGWPNCPNLNKQLDGFRILSEQADIPIINCSRDTALTCFERKELKEV